MSHSLPHSSDQLTSMFTQENDETILDVFGEHEEVILDDLYPNRETGKRNSDVLERRSWSMSYFMITSPELARRSCASTPVSTNGSERFSSSAEEACDNAKSFPFIPSSAPQLTLRSPFPISSIGNSTIFAGRQKAEGKAPVRVALKLIRIIDEPHDSAALSSLFQKLRAESRVWRRLDHKNILPLLNLSEELGPSPILVYPFCRFGSIGRYLSGSQNVDRLSLIRGVAAGVSYLHCSGIVHGDLRPSNVLVDSTGKPRLCDFGVGRLISEAGFIPRKRTINYTAPELLATETPEGEPAVPTDASDVYSFGILGLFIQSSQTPRRRTNKVVVDRKALEELAPQREAYQSLVCDELWRVLEMCWTFDAPLRPNMDFVQEKIRSIR
ncbi:unnamed protein product [Mycena citricolor]|uniref:Protein kinase domain-containing protein n=1 Tax=Mycena citricolor TaxID=2018698 RepID=A0AAD2HL97_9AGAR|nr:unnamed protein product [Mycena citricolor]